MFSSYPTSDITVGNPVGKYVNSATSAMQVYFLCSNIIFVPFVLPKFHFIRSSLFHITRLCVYASLVPANAYVSDRNGTLLKAIDWWEKSLVVPLKLFNGRCNDNV